MGKLVSSSRATVGHANVEFQVGFAMDAPVSRDLTLRLYVMEDMRDYQDISRRRRTYRFRL